MSINRYLFGLLVVLAVGAGAILAGNSVVEAQDKTPLDHDRHMRGNEAVIPTMPGQDAFGAIQEIVRILEAGPGIAWIKVDLAALREHLIDMNEVTLKATAVGRALDNGLRIDVTGSGRTLEAIRRMLPAHARELNGLPKWRAATEPLPDGVRLTVTSSDPAETARIRGLGFIGLMVSWWHHQPHHLAMARGDRIH